MFVPPTTATTTSGGRLDLRQDLHPQQFVPAFLRRRFDSHPGRDRNQVGQGAIELADRGNPVLVVGSHQSGRARIAATAWPLEL